MSYRWFASIWVDETITGRFSSGRNLDLPWPMDGDFRQTHRFSDRVFWFVIVGFVLNRRMFR